MNDCTKCNGNGCAECDNTRVEQWQTMDSAPKDGTEILTIHHGYFNRHKLYYFITWWRTAEGWHGYESVSPEYWMSLPEPPHA